MKLEDVKKIVVVGAGNMGHQIATLCAIQGFTVVCSDVKEEVLQKAEAFVDKYLPGRVEKGKIVPNTEIEIDTPLIYAPFRPDLLKSFHDFLQKCLIENLWHMA